MHWEGGYQHEKWSSVAAHGFEYGRHNSLRHIDYWYQIDLKDEW